MRDLIYKTTPATKVVTYEHEIASTVSQNEKCRLVDGYGYIFHQNQECPALEIDKNTALLLFSLMEPGPLPSFIRNDYDLRFWPKLMDLISGAYMSVFLDSDFVTGQPATKRIQELYGPPHSQVQELSELAIKRAALMKLTSPEAYFNYLYAYNTCPANPHEKIVPEEEWNYLTEGEKSLENWNYHTDSPAWYYFAHRDQENIVERKTHKLYISPKPKHLPLIVQETANALHTIKGSSFKVGKGLNGRLRPDKCVAYFTCEDSLHKTAEKLFKNLQGVEAQGVPFTIAYDSDGLLSWGRDVYPKQGEQQSWRQWMVNKVVETLGDENVRSPATAYTKTCTAFERAGIDPLTFKPNATWIQAQQPQ